MNWTLRQQDQLIITVLLAIFFVPIFGFSFFEKDFTPEQEKTFRFQIDVNSATAAEFQTLPGIGEKLSAAIILYRQECRYFNTPDELINVRGIGTKKFEAVKPYLPEKHSQ
jgi:competence ComEA-like helix-hairpin-helix protein